jgi:hypothetical protein
VTYRVIYDETEIDLDSQGLFTYDSETQTLTLEASSEDVGEMEVTLIAEDPLDDSVSFIHTMLFEVTCDVCDSDHQYIITEPMTVEDEVEEDAEAEEEQIEIVEDPISEEQIAGDENEEVDEENEEKTYDEILIENDIDENLSDNVKDLIIQNLAYTVGRRSETATDEEEAVEPLPLKAKISEMDGIG